MFKRLSNPSFLAEYHGSHRTTRSCVDALARLLVSSVEIHRTLLLTYHGRHGLCLDTDGPERIFIRCGFTSGYAGEGPRGLAVALQLLRTFNIRRPPAFSSGLIWSPGSL